MMKPDYQDSKQLADHSYYDKLNKNDYYNIDEKFSYISQWKTKLNCETAIVNVNVNEIN